jgi:NAD-dependent dihydropyrimidine dehydrogenase PreA subunit
MVKIDLERCEGCSDCVEQCPMGVFQIVDGKSQAVNEEKCIECRLCETVCPKLAITVTKNDNPE